MNPFESISLVDLSANRQGPPGNKLSDPQDVLWNTDPSKPEIGERYDESIIPLKIMELINNQYYEKKISHSASSKTLSCTICLKHSKLPCNYSHCEFIFEYEGQIVTWENYKETLGKKKGAAHSQLRTKCKVEIEKMIIKEEIRINWP